MLPRITVVTPCYNAEAHIARTIESVLGQGYPNLDYIIMDGGSTDATLDIIERYRPHLAQVHSGRDDGPYAAIAQALDRAGGEVLAWLNADDLYLPGALRTVGEIMSDFPEVDWLTSRWHVSCRADGRLNKMLRYSGFSRQAFLDGYWALFPGNEHYRACIQQEATFWRRSLWQRAGGMPEGYKVAADFALWAAFFQHAELVAVDMPLAAFRFHGGNRSATQTEAYMAETVFALAVARAASGHGGIVPAENGLRLYDGKVVVEGQPGEPRWTLLPYRFAMIDRLDNGRLFDMIWSGTVG